MATVSDVLTKAASLLDRGVCRGANARLADGKSCGVFNHKAAAYSMYGALCAVLGPGLGGDASLQHSAAWKLVALRAWEGMKALRGECPRMEYALHDLNDALDGHAAEARGALLRRWAAEPEIAALGEWH